MSMLNIYDHQKLCLHKKLQIPINIKLGEAINQILEETNPKLLKNVISQLKKEYQEQHSDILNTQEKKDHVQNTLDKILNKKYNFAKQNIIEGEKFNEFYPETPIPLPVQIKDFTCIYCQKRSFSTNAALHSHYNSCLKVNGVKHNEVSSSEGEKKVGFRVLRAQGSKEKENQFKTKKVVVVQNVKVQDEVKKENGKEKQVEKEERFKRERPGSSYSFDSNIFYGDD